MGLGECDYCGGKLNGVEHANGNLGAYSFSQACDACQMAAHQAFRMAQAAAVGDRASAWLKNGGVGPIAPAAAAPAPIVPPPAPKPATGGSA